MAKILIVEDDPASLEFLRKFLQREGHTTLEASDGDMALQLSPQADLVLLDVMLPILSGWEIAEILRRDYPNLPIIMLTALASTDDEIQGLELGADDYVTKPYELRELRARIKALLRRVGLKKDLSFGDLTISPGIRQAKLANKLLNLSKVEFDLLVTLAQYPGQVFSRERLLERIWGSDYQGMDRVVDVRMVSLRKKLGEGGRGSKYIETVRGLGYRFKNKA